MKFALPFLIIFFTAFAIPAHAEDLSEVDQRIHEAEQAIDQVAKDIQIKIESRRVSFPEYQIAFDAFLSRSNQVTSDFKSSLRHISTKVSSSLSNLYSDLNAVENEYRRNPSPGLRNLVKEQKRRITEAKENLNTEINMMYKAALINVFSQGGKIIYPVSRGSLEWDSVVPTVAAFAFGGVMAGILVAADVAEMAGTAILISGTAGVLFCTLDDCINLGKKYYDQMGQLRTGNYNEALDSAAEQVFSECSTAGCVYLLAEDFKYWFEKVQYINQDVALIDGLNLEALSTTYPGKADRRMDEIAETQAKKLPIGRFEQAPKVTYP